MNIISLTLTDQKIDQLKDSLSEFTAINPPQYANFRIAEPNLNVTIYNSKKVVFQGSRAIRLAEYYKPKINLPQAGSDETGNGSYFGPICVCACYIDDEIYAKIKHLNLDDSKAINDDYINEIGQFLRDTVPHSLLVLDNKTYNNVQKTTNQNKMKAMLHNQAFINLNKQVSLPKLTVIDQFTPKDTYYRYLDPSKPIFDKLIFETKAEGKYIAVAVASIIARFAFNIALMQMSKHYEMGIPSGAGKTVDIAAQAFIDRYGKSELNNVAKVHFANTKRLR